MLKMKGVVQLSIICCLAVIVNTLCTGFDRQNIAISNDGGYTDILIAISEEVPENLDIINKLQKYFTEASSVLLTATKNRLFFKNITIIVPQTWKHNSSWSTPMAGETCETARVLVDLPSTKWNNVPYTQQPFACGVEGWFIHFTPEYLTRDATNDVTYKPAKKIVKEFAHLKWGLFDEDIPAWDQNTSRFYKVDDEQKPIGCSGSFVFLNTDTEACGIDLQTGQYKPSCRPIIKSGDSSASLLAFEYADEIVDFCSTDDGVIHNAVVMNLQNKKCNDRSAWEVMNDLADFETDYSTTRASETSTSPVFNIIQQEVDNSTSSNNSAVCKQDIVCLCLDVSASMTFRIGIMSQSVNTYIIAHLRNGTAVGIVSFSTKAIVNAPMTVINNLDDRLELVTKVPTVVGGGTGIGGGLRACQTLLRDYSGDKIDKTRIVLLSDGRQNGSPYVEEVLPSIIEDGIVVDTILYSQGSVLYGTSNRTSGRRHLATDSTSSKSLDLFLALTAVQGCDVNSTTAVLSNTEIIIPAGEESYNGSIYLDVTVGVDTKLVFKYDAEINVTVNSPGVVINEFPSIDLIAAEIPGVSIGEVAYTIHKLVNISIETRIIFTATSAPVPGEKPIVFIDWTNDADVEHNGNYTFIGYMGAFQRMSGVSNLKIIMFLEQPNGDIILVEYVDDGTGKDSVPNDGIYTGFLPAHRINGAGGTYYSLTINITGEGSLYGTEDNNRKKRCLDCNDLGYITRTITGGVLVINNWHQVEDTTPPERITDLRVLNAAAAGDNIFTLGWTAPGDDLNIGTVTGYEFEFGVNSSKDYMVSLTANAILSNVSELLVEARESLQIQINASEITPEMVGLRQSTKIHTYYFRMRTYDAKNNFADWSNPAPASYFDPSMFTSSSSSKTSEQPRTVQNEVIEKPDALVLALSVLGAVIVAAALAGLLIFCYIKSKTKADYTQSQA